MGKKLVAYAGYRMAFYGSHSQRNSRRMVSGRDHEDRKRTGSGVSGGRLFRRVCRARNSWGEGMTEKVVWHIVKENAAKLGLSKVAPHYLRRSCARLCHAAGGELEQIQFLLSHVSVQTTERYLGCKQRLKEAVNDKIGIEPEK